MRPLARDPRILSTYIDHYEEEYRRAKALVFSRRITLGVVCRRCRKEFSAGIVMEQQTFATITTMANTHECPFCRHLNVVQKADYEMIVSLQ